MTTQESLPAAEQAAAVEIPYQFKNPTGLTGFLRTLLYIYIGILAVSGISDLFEYQLLQKIAAQGFPDNDFMNAAAQANDLRQGIIGIAMFILAIWSFVLMLKWIYRSNNNARALGAKDMRYTPGWCIGWFFIPIMSLWKPLSVMREIWKASLQPSDWQNQPVPGIIGWWWALFLISNILSQISFRVSLAAATSEQLQASAILSAACAPFEIIATLIFISLMTHITDAQLRHHEAAAYNPA